MIEHEHHSEKESSKEVQSKEAPKNDLAAKLLSQYNDITVKSGEGYYQALHRSLPAISPRELSELAATARAENGNKTILKTGDHIHLLDKKTSEALTKSEKGHATPSELQQKFAHVVEHGLPALHLENNEHDSGKQANKTAQEKKTTEKASVDLLDKAASERNIVIAHKLIDAGHAVTSTVDAAGHAVTNTVDAAGHAVKSTVDKTGQWVSKEASDISKNISNTPIVKGTQEILDAQAKVNQARDAKVAEDNRKATEHWIKAGEGLKRIGQEVAQANQAASNALGQIWKSVSDGSILH